MKINFLVDSLASKSISSGGLQNYVTRIASALQNFGDHVQVFCTTKRQQTQNQTSILSITNIQNNHKVLEFLQLITFHQLDGSLKVMTDAIAVKRELGKHEVANIIQSPNFNSIGLFVKKNKSKLIVRASSYRPLWDKSKGKENNLDNRVKAYLEKKLYKKADAVFAPSRYLANILEKEICRKVDVLPTPLPDLSVEEEKKWYDQHLQSRKYILYFGDMIGRKGIFILAQAMKEVWQKYPEALLVMAGPDKVVRGIFVMKEFFDAVHPYEDLVIYSGELDHESLFPVIKNAFFVVLPSIEDNCPNTMLEAMALGKAVLGTIGSSLDEFYPISCQSLLVPKEDSAALAEKIKQLWSLSTSELDAYGEELRLHIKQKHSIDQATRALREYYVRISTIC